MALVQNTIEPIITSLNGIVWGPYMLALLGGTGLYLMLGLGFLPLRKLIYGFKQLLIPSNTVTAKGDISAFNALMTILSAIIGTGHIAGVAPSILFGGTGAVIWVW